MIKLSSDIPREIVIDKDDEKQKALEFFSDSYTRSILATVMDEPKSALRIADETKIPFTTVYRKLRNLLEHNTIRISGYIAENGKKNFLYKSKIKSFHITFTQDKLAILVNASGTCKFCLQSHT